MLPYRMRLAIPRLRASFASRPVRRRLLIGTVIGLGCLHFAMAVASIQHKSATYDEIAHITAGYSYWKQRDYRLHPENGNLPQRWLALPLVAFDPELNFPDLGTDSWRRSDLWKLGDEFFHQSGNDVERMLLTARSAIAVVSVALCVLVWYWSRRLFGNLGGLISLVLCAFSPAILAHGRLATSDLMTTFFFAAAVWSIWELLHQFSLARLVAGALAVSGLFLCKTSAVLILPMAVLLALISLTPRQTISILLPRGRDYELKSQWSRRGYVLGVTLFIGIAAYSSVWAAYGFRYAASPAGDHEFYKFRNVESLAQRSGSVGTSAKWLAEHRVLPEAYLYGAAFVAAHEERPAFLNGEYETTGWRHFFPYCLAVKTPLAFFGLLALGIVALPAVSACRSHAEHRHAFGASPISLQPRWAQAYRLIPIAISLLILWAVLLGTQLNIGHRHLLPTYPFMFVLAGAAAGWCRRETRVIAGAIGLLLIWFVADSLASYPHYLSYFNQLVPRDKAYRHVVDSSLDWGQDLPSLKKWLDKNTTDDEPVFLGYFGTASPAYYGIAAKPLPLLGLIAEPVELTPGTYCISATCLQAVYGFAPGRWNLEYEARYQELSARFASHEPPTDLELRLQCDAFHARRLTAHLRNRDPDDHVGYSILIYRVTSDELHSALNGTPAELDSMSWPLRRALQAARVEPSSSAPARTILPCTMIRAVVTNASLTRASSDGMNN